MLCNEKICPEFDHIWSCNDIEISCRDFCASSLSCPLNNSFCGGKMISLFFYLSGNFRLFIIKNGATRKYHLPPHTYSLHYDPNGQYLLEYLPCKRIRILRILFPCRCFEKLMERSDIISEIDPCLEDPGIINRIKSITPSLRLVINQILDHAGNGTAEYFFFLARIFDLLNHIYSENDKAIDISVTPSDRLHVGKAQNIFINNMADPPALNDLASRVGVSSAKLKQIFPKVCGMPPYAYLRKLRMEKAMDLIRNGKMNITEIAYDIGYNSISHFSKVFAGYFGIKPSQVRSLCSVKR